MFTDLISEMLEDWDRPDTRANRNVMYGVLCAGVAIHAPVELGKVGLDLAESAVFYPIGLAVKTGFWTADKSAKLRSKRAMKRALKRIEELETISDDQRNTNLTI